MTYLIITLHEKLFSCKSCMLYLPLSKALWCYSKNVLLFKAVAIHWIVIFTKKKSQKRTYNVFYKIQKVHQLHWIIKSNHRSPPIRKTFRKIIWSYLQLREIQMLGAWGGLKRLTTRRLSKALKQRKIIYILIHTNAFQRKSISFTSQ